MSKTALITGASRGIGAGIAESFAAAGYDLYLVARNSKYLLEVNMRELTTKYGIKCRAFLGDVGSSSFVTSLFEEINDIDVLVNCAGISHIGLLQDMTDDEWKKIMSTNLDGVFFMCRAAAQIMVKKHSGSIINISSVWGNVGASMEVAYSATKGGINAFTKALGKELAPSNIAVNAIACGIIDTDMNKCFSKEDLDALMTEIPSGRMGTPAEVGALALHIAMSPAYLTGQIITMDGGWT